MAPAPASGPDSTSLPGGSRRGAELIGRERERTLLRRAFDDAVSGEGGLLLLSGEAGIGKTTLLDWLASEAQAAHATVLWGRAYDLSVTPPYGPWLEVARRYGTSGLEPGAPAFLDDPAALAALGSQQRLFDEVTRFFQTVASEQPLVILLDDLHWADQASLDLLRYLARDLDGHRLIIVASFRSDELTRRHPLTQLLPSLVREAGAARLELQPLDQRATRDLIGRRYQLPETDRARLERYLGDRAEGNPFYAGELLRTLEEQRVLLLQDGEWTLGLLEQVRVPRLLMQVIEGRLTRLSEEARGLLQVAAIIGQDVPLDLWQRVSGASDDALVAAIEQGLGANLIEEGAGSERYRFRHALLREALYEEVIALRRRTWHRVIAEVLAQEPNPDPDRVAYHYRQAGDARAVAWLMSAGERAQQAYAWIAAADRFGAALAKMTEQGTPAIERAVLLYRIAGLLRYSDVPRALALKEEARQLATEAGELGFALHCQAEAGLYSCFVGNVRAGLAEMERASDAFDALPPEQQARSLLLLGEPAWLSETVTHWLGMAGRLEAARSRGERLLTATVAQDVGGAPDEGVHGDGLFGSAIAQALLGQPAAARQTFQQARSWYEASGHHAMVEGTAQAELQLVQLPYYSSELESRRRLSTVAEAAARQQQGAIAGEGDTPWGPSSLPLDVIEGGWAEAMVLATHAFDEVDWYRVVIGAWLAALARDQGDLDLARRVVAELTPDGPRTEPGSCLLWGMLKLQRVAAQLALDAHDLPAARAWLEAHDRWLTWSGAVLGQAEGALLWAQYHHVARDLDLARRRADDALSLASHPRQPLALLAIHRFLGSLAREARHFDTAEDQLQLSLGLAQDCAVPFERALTLLELAELRAARGQPDAARKLLAGVRVICEPLGAEPTLARAASLEQQLSGSTARPFGLSEREAEVLRLVTEGLTDAQIAERLFISRRTVNTHLTNILNKLGVSSRAAAAALAARHDLI